MGKHAFIRNQDTCTGENCSTPNPKFKAMSNTVMNKPVYCQNEDCGMSYGTYGEVVDNPDIPECPKCGNTEVNFQPKVKEVGIFG